MIRFECRFFVLFGGFLLLVFGSFLGGGGFLRFLFFFEKKIQHMMMVILNTASLLSVGEARGQGELYSLSRTPLTEES